MISEEKLLTAKCEDLLRCCDKYACGQFSSFLNENEQAVIKREIGNPVGYNVGFFGGFKDAQRKIFGVFPEWQDVNNEEFPVLVIKIIKTYNKQLTHRDYLGTVLSTGIERSCIGDIIIDENTAYVFAHRDIADYVANNIDKISNVGVRVSVENFTEITPPEPKFEIINTIAASSRLDAVVAAMLKVSRKISQGLIKNACVDVNHAEVSDTSYQLKIDDVISVRGHGRFIFSQIGDETRSQRMHIVIKKYI